MAFFGKNLAAKAATTNTAVNNAPKAEQPVMQQVDVAALFGALNTTGSAKLSDFSKPVETTATPQPQTAAQPAPVATPADGAAAPTEAVAAPAAAHAPKAQTKTEPAAKTEYVAPASPQEAHDRIEAAVTAVPAKVTKQQVGDTYVFGGKTFGLRQAFTMLGGAFDKQSQSWSISMERYENPVLCQDTFVAEIARNERRNERIEAHKEEIEAIRAEMRQQFANDLFSRGTEAIRKVIAEDIAKARKEWEQERTPAGMITIDQAKDNTRKAINLLLQNLSKMNTASLEALVTKAYAS